MVGDRPHLIPGGVEYAKQSTDHMVPQIVPRMVSHQEVPAALCWTSQPIRPFMYLLLLLLQSGDPKLLNVTKVQIEILSVLSRLGTAWRLVPLTEQPQIHFTGSF